MHGSVSGPAPGTHLAILNASLCAGSSRLWSSSRFWMFSSTCTTGQILRGEQRSPSASAATTHRFEGQRGLPSVLLVQDAQTHSPTRVHIWVEERWRELTCTIAQRRAESVSA